MEVAGGRSLMAESGTSREPAWSLLRFENADPEEVLSLGGKADDLAIEDAAVHGCGVALRGEVDGRGLIDEIDDLSLDV